MKTISLFVALLFYFVPAAGPGDAGWPFFRAGSRPEQLLLRQLSMAAHLSVEEEPMEEVLRQLQDDHSLPIVVASPAAELLDADDPVSLRAEDASVRSVLNLLLEPKGLTYVIRNDVLLVTVPQKATDLRVYNLSPLLDSGVERDAITATVRNVMAPSQIPNAKIGTERKPAQRVCEETFHFVAGGTLMALRATDQQHMEFSNALQSIRLALGGRAPSNSLDFAANSVDADPFAVSDGGNDPFGDAFDVSDEDPFDAEDEDDPFGDF